MNYIRINTDNNNTIMEYSKTPISAEQGEITGTTNHDFPTGQPPYFYCVSGGSVVVNNASVVASFTEGPYYKIFDYMNITDVAEHYSSPIDINYNILGLHKKRYFNKGELYNVEYYGHYDFTAKTYTDLVLHESRTFYRINEMVYRRELNICWYLIDGTTGATKHATKFYTQEESLGAGERRRRNCITNLKINAIGLIMAVSGTSQLDSEQIGWLFLNEFNPEINLYVEGSQTTLLNKIMTTQNHGWLDGTPAMLGGATVRQYLYSELDIDYTINNTYV